MDAQPTTSHDVVQAENQVAIDALRRLAGTRDDYVRMVDTQPSLTAADTQGAQQLLEVLSRFWSSPDVPGGVSRTSLLGQQLARVMKEEATLRGLDGTLTDQAASLATRIAAGGGHASLPPEIHTRELMLGDMPHAGSLIVLDDGTPGLALLFTAHGGWEAFDSLERLLESTRRRLLASVDVADGTGLETDEFAEAKVRGVVGSRELIGDVFETLAKRMVAVQSGRVALAADDYGLESDQPDAAARLSDRIRHEMSPGAMLDVDAIESLREARLLEAAQAARLAKVPLPVATAWYEARDAYNDALATAAMLRAATGVQPPLTLHAFASRELAARLAVLGVDTSPEAIMVDVGRKSLLPAPLDALDPLPGSTTARRIPLVDLACQNVGRFSLETLHAVNMEGTSLRDRLGHGAIRDMVRDLDIGNRYQAHVEERLRRGNVGALTRKLALAVQAAQMRLEAAEARLSYYLPGEPRSFIDDREERGFRWVEAVLDSANASPRVGRHDVAVLQLTYQQTALDGILVFGTRAPDSAPRIVMYTPGAPDGLTFREFDNRQDAAKRFLYHPAFREYLLDRLPAEFATVSANGATRAFAGDRLAHWVLGASGDASYTLTAEPFREREAPGDFLAAAYDATVEKYRRDARFLTRSTASADGDALLGYLQGRFNVDPVARLAADALAEVPASFARMMQASWRFYDHVKAGDTGQAVVAFTDGYVNALNLVVPPFAGGRHVAGAIVRSRAATRGVAGTGVRLTPARVRFEDRYAARGLRKPGKPDQDGIFRVQGQSYVEHDGTFYLVRYDTDYSRWRLAPYRGASDARFTGPVIERIDNQWVYAQDVGLPGGMRRLRQRFNRMTVNHPPAQGAAAAEAPPVAGVPAPALPMPLPAVMEPMRAEITAALADNPSALAMVRDDGTHLKFAVHPRSALIVDPHLHPDIAELSAHQRRVFMHELDTRFPLVAERVDVLNVRGWARADGRRVPSPPPSPGGMHVDDIQSPSISSSSGDTSPATPPLTPGQNGRWDEALSVARRAPRRPSAPSSSSAAIDVLPASEVVPIAEWPERVWYFSERRFEPGYWPEWHQEGVTLGHYPGWANMAPQVHTHPVSARPPESPLGVLAEALGTSPVQQAGQRDPLGYWMQIDTARLRVPEPRGATHVQTWRMGLQMRRRVLPNGEFQYMLQSTLPIHIPSTYVISVGRRGGRGHALGSVL